MSAGVHERFFGRRTQRVVTVRCGAHAFRVSVWYGTNSGPGESGFTSVPHVGWDPGVAGFPVIKATVSSTARGYANQPGWVQIVRHLGAGVPDDEASPDPMPMMRDRGVPFPYAGYLPTFYDAPFWRERPRVHWQADLYLCPVVRVPSREAIAPVFGVRWGFRIPRAGADPEVRPLAGIGPRDWAWSLPWLECWFPGWRFARWRAPAPASAGVSGRRTRSPRGRSGSGRR